MSVVARSSTIITNRDAQPRVHNSSYLQDGAPKSGAATMPIATGDTSTSTYRMFQIPSGARLTSLRLWSDDCGSNTTIHVGLSETVDNGGAAVSASLFASTYSIKDGAVAGVDIRFSNLDIINVEKRIWELLSLTADPLKSYDVVVTLAATCDVGGDMSLEYAYVI